MLFLAVSFLAIFAGNKIGENTTSIFHLKEEFEDWKDTRECSRPKRTWPTRLDSLAVWGLLVWPSSAASPPVFAYALIYTKN
jgi:hypothetical protein